MKFVLVCLLCVLVACLKEIKAFPDKPRTFSGTELSQRESGNPQYTRYSYRERDDHKSRAELRIYNTKNAKQNETRDDNLYRSYMRGGCQCTAGYLCGPNGVCREDES